MQKIVLLSEQFYIQLFELFYKFKFFEAFTIRWFIRIIHFSFMEFVNYSYGYIFKKTQKPFKCNNHTNAKSNLCRKQWTIFMRKQWTVLINAKNIFYECSMQIWIYSKHDVQRANFINVETDFINAEEQIRPLWNLNMKKHSDLAFKFRKHNFTRCFMRKHGIIF